MPRSLGSIVALQETLSELGAARASLDGIPDWMAELHVEHTTRRAEIDEVELAKAEAESQRRYAEGELQDAQERLRHFQSQISRVSTQREYGALLKEIDTVKGQIGGLEQSALASLEASEEAESKLEEMNEAFRELDERYRNELAKWESEKPVVASRVAELERRSAELREEIPRQVLVLFERLYERTHGDAVARIQRMASRGANSVWHCSACSFSLRPQIVVDVRNEAIHQCETCKRILYWQDDGDETA